MIIKKYRKVMTFILNKIFPHNWYHHIHLEPTSYCNLSCVHCYRESHNYENKNKTMSFENIKIILDTLNPYFISNGFKKVPKTLQFQGIAEPTVHKDIVKIVEYARSRGFRSTITTNMSYKNFHDFNKLFDSGFISSVKDQIEVSNIRYEVHPYNTCTLGNILDESYEYIVNSEKRKLFLSNIKNSIKNEICKKCVS